MVAEVPRAHDEHMQNVRSLHEFIDDRSIRRQREERPRRMSADDATWASTDIPRFVHHHH
jgi:hypothetical protein